jgi:chorismate synthase
MLRFLTAGESHGPQLTVVVDGMVAGLPLSAPRDLDPDLRRRQGGYGRGGRQLIERDAAEITSGVRGGRTLGSPVTLVIRNRDWDNWRKPMQVEARGFTARRVTRVRPGHADLAGALKYGFDDVRNVLERASARETAARVGAGGVARALLKRVGIDVHSVVRRIGPVELPEELLFGRYASSAATSAVAEDERRGRAARRALRAGPGAAVAAELAPEGLVATPGIDVDWEAVEASPVRCPDPETSERMVAAIDEAREQGDTLGGVVSVVATGVPAGLGTYAQWDRRLDGLLAQAMCSIQSVKAVELGAGVAAAMLPGSAVHDAPRYQEGEGFHHLTNRQGGLTGGVTDGEPVWAQVHFKPISTLLTPMRSVDLATHEEINAHYERSDICVVPAGGVVAEAMMAWVLAQAVLDKFGGDTLAEVRRAVAAHRRRLR